MRRITALAVALLALSTLPLAGQVDSSTLAAQSLRPYWHVFAAYAVAWLLVFGWVFSVAWRLSRLERSLER